MGADKKSAWLKKLDKECPYQVVLPRQQLADDSDIMDFLISTWANSTCMSKTITRLLYAIVLRIRSTRKFSARRFEPKIERFKLAG